jgi:hypothetical protein
VRRKLGVKPGQKYTVSATSKGSITLNKTSGSSAEQDIMQYAGILDHSQTAWGKRGMDASEWLREQRDLDRP